MATAKNYHKRWEKARRKQGRDTSHKGTSPKAARERPNGEQQAMVDYLETREEG